MLTLDFREQLSDDVRFSTGSNSFYEKSRALIPMEYIRFSLMKGESLYMINANPLYHKKGVLHKSDYHAFLRRGINIPRIKDAIENSPVVMRVTVFDSIYYIGKGFIAQLISRSITERQGVNYDEEKLEILFAVTSKIGKTVNSPDELKIYIHRLLYEDKYKRLMSTLKPYMANHKGDIIVTTSINNYLLYNFSLPNFNSIQSRMKFEDNMKELFFRSIKYSKWRKEEDERIAKRMADEAAQRAKDERDRLLQENMMELINAEEQRIAATIIEPEVVEELPNVGEEIDHTRTPEAIITEIVTNRMNQDIEAWAERTMEAQEESERQMREYLGLSRERQGDIPEERPFLQGATERQEQLHQEEVMREWRHWMGLTDSPSVGQTVIPQSPISPEDGLPMQEIISSVPSPQLEPQQEQLPTSQIPTQDMEVTQEQSQPVVDIPTSVPQSSAVEEMSEEEMMRIMEGFSINPENISYTVTLDPATDEPVVQQEVQLNEEEEVTEDSTVVILDEDEVFEDDRRSEDELDNDPDAYEDAVVVESHASERAIFSAMEGGREE